MFLYLDIKVNVNCIPPIDSISMNIDGKPVLCTWEESDAYKEDDDCYVFYKFKGVRINNEYANEDIKESSINLEKINWKRTKGLGYFEYIHKGYEFSDKDIILGSDDED